MKDVIVTVKTSQFDGEKEEKMELTSEGKFWKKQNEFLIKYQDSMLADEYGTVETTIKVAAGGAVTINRSGAYQSRFTLEKGKRCDSLYSTPFGTMAMGFFGEKVENRLNEKGGELELEYTVDFNRAQINKNTIFVTVREV